MNRVSHLLKNIFRTIFFQNTIINLNRFIRGSENQRNYTVVYELNDGEDKEKYPYWVSVVLCTNDAEKWIV